MNKLSKNSTTRLATKQTDGGISQFKQTKNLVIEKAEHVVSFKVTQTEKDLLDDWVNDIQNLRGKKVAKAKLLRALCHMANSVDEAQLIEVIKDIS